MSFCAKCHSEIPKGGSCFTCGYTPKVIHTPPKTKIETFYGVTVPASMGDDVTGAKPATNGRWKNAVVTYEANGKVYIYDTGGIPIYIGDTTVEFNDIHNRPYYADEPMTSDTRIPDVDKAVAAEAALREEADAKEKAEREEADAQEKAAREEADAQEKAARELADEQEKAARKLADEQIRNDLEAEAEARDAEDKKIVERTKEAIGREATAREEKDVDLQEQIDAITASSDVVDVVPTHAGLDYYDTKTLTDKDIIKVLKDEEHDNATTYYRWVDKQWEFVGLVGPYYTVAEMDEKLDAIDHDIENLTDLMPAVLQETGDSEHDVMSQKAVTEELAKGLKIEYTYNDPGEGAPLADNILLAVIKQEYPMSLTGAKKALEEGVAQKYFPVGLSVSDGTLNPWIVGTYTTINGKDAIGFVRTYTDPDQNSAFAYTSGTAYAASDVFTRLNSTYLDAFSEEVKSVASTVTLDGATGQFHLLSVEEVYGTGGKAAATAPWQYWQVKTGLSAPSNSANEGRAVHTTSGNEDAWWLRDVNTAGNGHALVNAGDNAGEISTRVPSASAHGVLPIFYIVKES